MVRPAPAADATPPAADWPARVELALRVDDHEVAAHSASGWRAATGGDARSTAALARVHVHEGALGEARALLEEAHRRAGSDVDDDARLELLRAEGLLLLFKGDAGGAARRLKEALHLARRLGRAPEERLDLLDGLVQAHVDAEHLEEAERELDQRTEACDEHGTTPPDPLLARTAARLMFAQGDARGASQSLEQLLGRPPDPGSDGGWLPQLLAQVWIAQERYPEAERLLRGAIESIEGLNRRTTPLRHEHGRALLGLGRLREAEKELRRALAEAPESKDAAFTRHELARCLLEQGRFDEAEPLIDASLAERGRGGASEAPQHAIWLFEKARVRRLRGDLAAAGELFREALRLGERVFGREHPMLLPTLAELGGMLIDLGRPREAEPLLRRAERLALRAGHRLGLAAALTELARAQAALSFPHAGDTARRALAAFDDAESEPAPALHRELSAIASAATPHPAAPPRRRR